MGRAALAAVVALLAMSTAVDARARDDRKGDVTSAPAQAAPASKPARPAAPAKRLKLGPYVDPYGPVAVERIFDVPHFETRVEVEAKAMDSRALTARMEWWMRDFEPLRGAVSHHASAPSLEEIREYRPHPPDSLNFVPIIDWLVDKLNKKN